MNNKNTIHELFENLAKDRPQQIAVIYEDISLTYFELNERANQLANYLLKAGVKNEGHVAICMERSIELLITMIGILKAGGAYVSLDSQHPEARLDFILKDNNNPILITNENEQNKFSNYEGKIILFDNKEINNEPRYNINLKIANSNLAYIIYTSGSTGTPKGTLVEHKSVVNYCEWFQGYSNCKPEDRIDFSANHIFDMAVTLTIAPLMLGLTIVICNDKIKKDVSLYLNHINNQNINIIKLTPSFFKILVQNLNDDNNLPLTTIHTIILGGENLQTSDCATWLKFYQNHTIFNEYGPTEATVGITQYKITHSNVSKLPMNIPIGKPGHNMECHIIGENNKPVVNDEVGELYIGGISLARGYLNQPKLTDEKFLPDFLNKNSKSKLYRTGDLCRLLPSQDIEYLGRIDNQVKIRGYRIELGEIEHCLNAHSAIKDSVVLAQKDEKLVAYYILEDLKISPGINEIIQYLQEHIPAYMIPSAYVRVNSFPLNGNNKLDKNALPIPRFTSNQYYITPKSDLEKLITSIWAEELNLNVIGTEDNFFELGGHSLTAARIVNKINTTLDKDISISEFYKAPTIKQFINVIYNAKNIVNNEVDSQENIVNKLALQPLSDFQLLLWLSNTFEPKAKKMNIFARKRLQGNLNIKALEFAFNESFKKHEIILSHVLKLRPMQIFKKNLKFKINEKNISSFNKNVQEEIMKNSAYDLIHYYPWAKKMPLIIARLFKLSDEEIELQFCMPHIIADEVSPEILFSDLSKFYLLFENNENTVPIQVDKRYKNYQINEQKFYDKNRINADIMFWEKYFDDAILFKFPKEKILPNMTTAGLPYSTYTEIPENGINNLHQFCAENHVSINAGLCAVLSLALVNCNEDFNQYSKSIFMNLVKSTRNNQYYDETIGCFLQLEPIKVNFSNDANIIKLAKEIHQATIDTTPHQRCSGLVKLSSIGSLRKKNNLLKRYLINSAAFLYTKILPTPNLDHKTLSLCERLIISKKSDDFIINVNVHKSFIHKPKELKDKELFGLKPKKTKSHQFDLLEINRLLDVCFLRDENNKPFVVLSANLIPKYREEIAKEMIRIINYDTLDKLP